jgi:hypothetical protein
MISRMRRYFKDAKLARMSDGTLCVVRDLGLVKGGKGMKHHETLMTFTARGLLDSARTFGAAWPHLGGQSGLTSLPSALQSSYDAGGEFR